MLEFKEDKSNCSNKKLIQVIMKYEDGSQDIITPEDPTMVLIGYKYYQEMKMIYDYFKENCMKQ